jgi:hypothetical protein
MLYLASAVPLKTSEFSAESPGFYVGEISPEEKAVRVHFSKPFVYFLGSHTNCGCGFDYNPEYSEGESGQPTSATSRRALSALLHALTKREDVEVFACWSGDETAEVVARKQASPHDFLDRRVLGEGYLVSVTAAAPDPRT